MGSRKYLSDYKFSETVNAKGRIKTSAVYSGKYFVFTDPASAARQARLMFPLSIAAWLVFAAALLPKTGSSRLMFVMLPFVFSALPLGFLTGDLFRALSVKGELIRSEADKFSTRVPASAVWLAVLPGAALVAVLAVLVFRRELLC